MSATCLRQQTLKGKLADRNEDGGQYHVIGNIEEQEMSLPIISIPNYNKKYDNDASLE